MVYNYEKFLFLGIMENTGLTVLVVHRPSEQFPLTIPTSTPPGVKGHSPDEHKQVSMVHFVT